MMQISIIFSKNEVLGIEYDNFRISPKHYKTIVFDVSMYSCKAITLDRIQFALKLNQK